MIKKIVLSLGLIGCLHANAWTLDGIKLAKGAALLLGGAWALERLKNTWDDLQKGDNKPTTCIEDIHNVVATTACVALFAYFGQADHLIPRILGSGAVLGGSYVAAKCILPGARNLKLREFLCIIGACALGLAGLELVDIPILSPSSSRR